MYENVDPGFVQRMEDMALQCYTMKVNKVESRTIRNVFLCVTVGALVFTKTISLLFQPPVNLEPFIFGACALCLIQVAYGIQRVMSNKESIKTLSDIKVYLRTCVLSQDDSALLEQLADFVARGNTKAIASTLKRANDRPALQKSPLLTLMSETFLS